MAMQLQRRASATSNASSVPTEAAQSIEAQAGVAADGARSTLREAAGIGAQTWNYEQVALVTNVFTQRFHDHVAYERFTPAGPTRAAADVRRAARSDLDLRRRRSPQAVAQSTTTQFLARLQDGLRLPSRPLHARRHTTAVSAGADARRRTRGRAPRRRRQRRADAASDRRSGLQSRPARRREPRRGAGGRTRAAARRVRSRRRPAGSNAIASGATPIAATSCASPTAWCGCSRQPFGPCKLLRRRRHARIRPHAGGEGRAVAAVRSVRPGAVPRNWLVARDRSDDDYAPTSTSLIDRRRHGRRLRGGARRRESASSPTCASQCWKRIRRRSPPAGDDVDLRVSAVSRASRADPRLRSARGRCMPRSIARAYDDMIVWDAAGKPRGAGIDSFLGERNRASRTWATSSRTAACSGRSTIAPPFRKRVTLLRGELAGLEFDDDQRGRRA